MNKQYKCNIILDLLPLYTDGITSDVTDAVIEEHLKECEKCRQAYEDMSGEINLGLQQKKRRKRRRLRYKKKSVGRMVLLGYFLLLLLIMALCVLDVVLFL